MRFLLITSWLLISLSVFYANKFYEIGRGTIEGKIAATQIENSDTGYIATQAMITGDGIVGYVNLAYFIITIGLAILFTMTFREGNKKKTK